MNQPTVPIPPQNVVPGQPGSVSASAQNAVHRWVSGQAGIIDTRSADPRMAFIRIADDAPTSDGLLTGYKLHDDGSLTPSSWVDDETVHVIWPNGSTQPPELPANTFGESRIYLGWRIGIASSGGNVRAVYLVSVATVVVPIYLANLTPSGGYHDATIDPEGGGVGSSSTCWAKCLNSGSVALTSFGPYLGLLSGKVTNGSERPRVLFFADGITITGEDSTDTPVSAFVQTLAFNVTDFDITSGGAIASSHDNDQVNVWQAGVPVGIFNTIDFIDHSTISPSVVDAGSGRATVQMQAVGGPFVPESDVATAPAANKIMRADANGTHTFTPAGGGYEGLNVGAAASAPASLGQGGVYYDTTLGEFVGGD